MKYLCTGYAAGLLESHLTDVLGQGLVTASDQPKRLQCLEQLVITQHSAASTAELLSLQVHDEGTGVGHGALLDIVLRALVVPSHRSAHCHWGLAAVDDGSDHPQACGETVFVLVLEELLAELHQRCTDVLPTQWDVLVTCRKREKKL